MPLDLPPPLLPALGNIALTGPDAAATVGASNASPAWLQTGHCMAAELGREVMAVFGSLLDPRAAIANDLIRQGAALHMAGPLPADQMGGAGSQPGSGSD